MAQSREKNIIVHVAHKIKHYFSNHNIKSYIMMF